MPFTFGLSRWRLNQEMWHSHAKRAHCSFVMNHSENPEEMESIQTAQSNIFYLLFQMSDSKITFWDFAKFEDEIIIHFAPDWNQELKLEKFDFATWKQKSNRMQSMPQKIRMQCHKQTINQKEKTKLQWSSCAACWVACNGNISLCTGLQPIRREKG